jgi:FMN phosphatase YigB (HAD superfamily)
MKIKNIIFDLGGVILDINSQKTIQAFKTLGAYKADDLFINNKQIVEAFGLGKIGPSTFRTALQNNLGIIVSDQEFDKAWNTMIITIPKPRLALIKKLNTNYRCFLFSNTNSIHYECVINFLRRDHQIDSFAGYFEKEYYSYRMGLLKPDKASYQRILNENQLIPRETLFIDDTLSNIETAKLTGMHVLHLKNELMQIDLTNYIREIEK